jgi:uncharacterized protein YigE (DUF2233 family)
MLVLLLALCGCGAVTSSTVAYHEDKVHDAKDAIIYVYRLKSMVGGAVPWNVYLDAKIVGVLRQNAYMPLHVPAGEHSLKIGDDTSVVISDHGKLKELVTWTDPGTGKFVLVPGGVYYFRSEGFSVTFLSKDEAMPELSNMYLDTGM